jgi:hypothetical protein
LEKDSVASEIASSWSLSACWIDPEGLGWQAGSQQVPLPLEPTMIRQALSLVVAVVLFFHPFSALAMITGGAGNKPINDPGWPKEASGIFNHPARIAWWEGPPFGGGQWHAEYRGDAKTLNAMLEGLAKLDVKTKRVVVHDGVGASFWLNPNREASKRDAARMDWAFMIWQPDHWERLRTLPPDLNPTAPADAQGPPTQIDVYAGGSVRWSAVVVPNGVEIVDERLEAHGFKPADGIVLEGKVIDIGTKKPLSALVRLEQVTPQAKGGYAYLLAAETTADSQGRWVIRNAPSGWYRVVVEKSGFAPRVASYAQFDDQPRWSSFDCVLAQTARVSGQVTDDAGQPLAGVKVQFLNVTADAAGRYQTPDDLSCLTDGAGHFHFDRLPRGGATITLSKLGHVRPGLGEAVKTPAENVKLIMHKSARLRVRVDFGAKARPAGYIVDIEPEGGSKVGTWGGSGNIDEHNEISFSDFPPGRYVLRGHPNPSRADEQTEPLAVDLKGGRLTEVTLRAKD